MSIRSRLTGLALGLFTLFALGRACQERRDLAQPFGRYSLQQVVDRSDSLCRILVPQVDHLSYVAEKQLSKGGGSGRRVWTVTCEDAQGRSVAFCVWNADTGDLQSVDRNLPRPAARRSPGTDDRGDALRIAQFWMARLPFATPGERWQLADLPQANDPSGDTWNVRWRTEGRRIAIKVDIVAGDLVDAQCEPPGSR